MPPFCEQHQCYFEFDQTQLATPLVCLACERQQVAETQYQQPTDYKALYHELLFAVGRKHPGESRHQTALRYIRQAESGSSQASSAQPPVVDTQKG